MDEAPHKWAVSERWTPRLGDNFTPIADAFLRFAHMLPRRNESVGLTSSEVVLIVHLMSFKWTRDAPFPSQEMLAKRMGISERAVRNLLYRLEIDGYVVRRRRRHNEYDLSGLFDKLERLLDEEEDKKSETPASENDAASVTGPHGLVHQQA